MVRVISGSAGGLKLKTAESAETRPTLDRVKEAMFSILTPYIKGRNVLDLFAGSGALGIEALSRGAEHGCFNDIDRACAGLVKENLKHTGLDGKALVNTGHYAKALGRFRDEKRSFGLILLDPPYGAELYEDAVLTIERYGLFDTECVIMCEHRREKPLPDEIGGFKAFRHREYGTVGLTFYKRGGDEIGD
ncbi:MAG: 16S rRNA (guanine(966)-N(2))-methyltransferase RsmD [Clostridia bacterium]|nr:16S rRNA (guanine(966)-N(2))-methyltransferase RsmD [Clostridia bacterium]